MTDDQFRALCNTYGFAPSRSLRELLDTAVAQARIAEREACARVCDGIYHQNSGPAHGEVRHGIAACAAGIRARGQA